MKRPLPPQKPKKQKINNMKHAVELYQQIASIELTYQDMAHICTGLTLLIEQQHSESSKPVLEKIRSEMEETKRRHSLFEASKNGAR